VPESRDRPAIEGGTPVRDTRVAFTRPSVGAEEERAVLEVLRSGWLTTGPVTERFEHAFRRFVGAPHAVGVSSCTAGLHLLLRAAGVGPGDEVVTSPMTFPATVNAILHAGARPVLADVLPRLLTLDPAAVRARVGPRTRALLVVHFAGWPAQMNGLLAVARAAGIMVIEDAAHAVGATYDGLSVGTLADGAAFSFYATKNLTTGEGGMVTTANEAWAERIRCERLHGLDVDASRRDGADYRHWEAVRLGFKYNLGDLAAALGLVQLERLPEMHAHRRAVDARYRRALADVKEIEVVEGPSEAHGAAHLFPILLAQGALRVGRDRVLAALLAENIGVGVHFRAIPAHRFFREEVGLEGTDVPVAMDASERTLSLPLSADMTEAEQDDVLTALKRIVRYYRA
jgi:dTDP-4-amino-4,6-dideoxygalactose transaminase